MGVVMVVAVVLLVVGLVVGLVVEGTQAVANPSVLARQFPDNINYG